jgi:8-oxo-dGTP pyrophosphatase MutT (NUDIX family)
MKRKAKVLFIHKYSSECYILLGKRISSNEEFWWIPGGSVEAGESDFQGALRELDEELFLTQEYTHVLETYQDSGSIPVSLEYNSNQAHNIIFFVVLTALNIVAPPEIKDEFEEMQWFNINMLPSNMSREYAFIETEFVQKIKQL